MMARRQLGAGAFVVLCSAFALALSAAADNWPRFRGPNGTGVSADREIPIEWDAKDGVLWKMPIPGAGNSSPVVWGKRVFIQSATADNKERLLLCVSALDGKVLWSRSVPGARAHTHERNTLASSTPAVDGKRVYAVFWDGRDMLIAAYDLEGRFLWKHDLGRFTSQHGAGVSPVVCGDKVIVANDQDRFAELVALDAATGQPAWKAPRKAYRACYSTPILLGERGKPQQLIVASTPGITSYDPRNGHENWDWTWDWKFSRMPLRTVASPVASGGLIFVSSGDGAGDRDTVAVRVQGGTVDKVWEKKRQMPYVPTMLAWGDYLYVAEDKGFADCLEAKTGKVVWRERLGEEVTASPVLINGKVYTVGMDGTVFVYAASPTFKLLARNTVGERVMATPAVADHRLFIRGQEHLFCIGKPRKERQASR